MGGDGIMMDNRYSPKVYPRQDTIYKSKKSLDFIAVKSKIYSQKKKTKGVQLMEWLGYAIVGILTGLTASIMVEIEDNTTSWKKNQSDDLIQSNGLGVGWLFFMGLSAILVLISSTTTVFWGPGAQGSGVAELIGYLNGVNYPNVFAFETFVTKVFGVVFAVVGGLCIGKEGPLAHIGATCGIIVPYLPLPLFSHFRNDMQKRRFIAAGTSAGVSAAFGAPIGGTLFAYEVSKPNTFWKFSVIWKVFFTCALAVFCLALFGDLMNGDEVYDVTAATLKFGTINISPPTLVVIPGSLIVGIMTGVMGAGFVLVNSNLCWWRKLYITSPWMKILEAVCFSIFSTTLFFYLPLLYSNVKYCKDDKLLTTDYADLPVQYTCPTGYYNPLASMLFNTEGSAIRTLISNYEVAGGIDFDDGQLAVFLAAWYFLVCVTYGVWVPAGLFLPGVIMGCAVGGLYADFQLWLSGTTVHDDRTSDIAVTFVIIGAGGMLAGYTRLSYSIVIIMLECTTSINIFVPMLFCVLVSRGVGNMLSPSLYGRATRLKQLPFLMEKAPGASKQLMAHQFMAKDLITLNSIADMPSMKKALESPHNNFPVMNSDGKCIGMMSRNFLVIVLQHRVFYDKSEMDKDKALFGTQPRYTEALKVREFNDDEGVRNIVSKASLNDEDGSLLTRDQLAIDAYKSTPPFNFHNDFDRDNGIPLTPVEKIINWEEFNVDIYSTEYTGKKVLDEVCEVYPDQSVDLRPYIWENPMSVTIYTKFERILEVFRMHHLRTLNVVNPNNGDLEGVITRQDMFAYMSL